MSFFALFLLTEPETLLLLCLFFRSLGALAHLGSLFPLAAEGQLGLGAHALSLGDFSGLALFPLWIATQGPWPSVWNGSGEGQLTPAVQKPLVKLRVGGLGAENRPADLIAAGIPALSQTDPKGILEQDSEVAGVLLHIQFPPKKCVGEGTTLGGKATDGSAARARTTNRAVFLSPQTHHSI